MYQVGASQTMIMMMMMMMYKIHQKNELLGFLVF